MKSFHQHYGRVCSHLEGGDVEILPEGQTQHIEVLAAISKCTGQRDEDCREEGEESERLPLAFRGMKTCCHRLTTELENKDV